jgi:hypothetical protein
MNFHHRPSSADGIVQPVPGFVSGGPNAGKEDNEKYPFSTPAKCFVDVVGSYASNEVCINWNSPLIALLAGVDAVLGDSSEVNFEVQAVVNNPPVLNVTSPLYDSKMGSDQPLKVKGNATDTDGISKVEIYVDARFYGISETGQFDVTINSVSYGSHTVTVLAYDSKGLTTEKTNKFSYYPVSVIPGKVEAENFSNMKGITTQTTTDTDGGLNVTAIDAADFIDYSLNIQQAGTYLIEYRVASNSGGGKLELRKISQAVLSSIVVDATGGTQKWATIADTINLAAGRQTLRIYCVAAGWNINWINFEYLNPTAVNDLSTNKEGISLMVLPNPVKGDFAVRFNLVELSPVEFSLHDIKGNLIEEEQFNGVQTNSGEFFWKLKRQLASGIYVINMHQNGKKIADCKLFKE